MRLSDSLPLGYGAAALSLPVPLWLIFRIRICAPSTDLKGLYSHTVEMLESHRSESLH
jgi:hypothetical protein